MEYHRRGGEEESRRIQEKYRESLNDLTVNSKPIINALTFAAEDHVHDGHAIDVVTVLEDHILRAAPEFKLPALYLLDSIVKNVKEPYISLFARNLPRMFCNAYEQAPNQQTQLLLVQLLKTWPGVFPKEAVRLIHDRLEVLTATPRRSGSPSGGGGSGSYGSPRRGGPPLPPPPPSHQHQHHQYHHHHYPPPTGGHPGHHAPYPGPPYAGGGGRPRSPDYDRGGPHYGRRLEQERARPYPQPPPPHWREASGGYPIDPRHQQPPPPSAQHAYPPHQHHHPPPPPHAHYGAPPPVVGAPAPITPVPPVGLAPAPTPASSAPAPPAAAGTDVNVLLQQLVGLIGSVAKQPAASVAASAPAPAPASAPAPTLTPAAVPVPAPAPAQVSLLPLPTSASTSLLPTPGYPSLGHVPQPSSAPQPPLSALSAPRTQRVFTSKPTLPADLRNPSTNESERAITECILVLYPPNYVICPTCGLRFSNQPALLDHMEKHASKNLAFSSARPRPVSVNEPIARRMWMSASEWMAMDVDAPTPPLFCPAVHAAFENAFGSSRSGNEPTSPSLSSKQPCLPADLKQDENFEMFLDEDEQEWMFRGVVLHPTTKLIVHVGCAPAT